MCLPGTTESVRERLNEEPYAARIDRRTVLLAGAGAALAATLPGTARGSGVRRVQDLTHEFRVGFPVYAGSNPARTTLTTIEADGFYKQEWTFDEHAGTHMDAPGHFIADGRRTPEIAPDELIVPIIVVDISERVASDPDAVVTVRDLRHFERFYGRIPRKALVCMYSGWESRVGSQEASRNVGADGKYHFPGFGKEAVDWLLERREIAGVGVDTLSLDHGPSTTFDVHTTLLGADRYGLENVANLKTIPPRGATAFVGVIPWQDGSGGPCRVLAHW